jgi:hypothetical protein
MSLRAQETANSIRCERMLFAMESPRAALSGILFLREEAQEVKGSLVNEFGVSAFDFVYTKASRKMRLNNVASIFDKWYIKRILRRDFGYAVEILFNLPVDNRPKKCEVERGEAGSLRVIDSKYDIIYTYSPFTTTLQDNDTP